MSRFRFPRSRIALRLDLESPLVQAPMAGVSGAELCAAVSEAGGLGMLPCGMLSNEQMATAVSEVRARTSRPFGLNFFCHASPAEDQVRFADWLRRLKFYFDEYGVSSKTVTSKDTRTPFNEESCQLVEELRPDVVSFHFRTPPTRLLDRVRAAGCFVLSSATSVAEARELEARGVDAIIAQGVEAGGHRATFLASEADEVLGLSSLLPQVADAVSLPVVATDGIADGRGIAAAFALGADAVQLGTAYLACDEATLSPVFRSALRDRSRYRTCITNVITGRLARGLKNRIMSELGPLNGDAPAYPFASGRAGAVARGSRGAGCRRLHAAVGRAVRRAPNRARECRHTDPAVGGGRCKEARGVGGCRRRVRIAAGQGAEVSDNSEPSSAVGT